MKKITILLIAVVACMWTGCRKPVDVSFDTQALTVAAEGGTYTAHLKSNGEWTLGSIAQWLAVTPNSGNGDATLTLVAQANTTGEARTMELIATTKDNTASMTLTQEAQAEVPGEDDMYDIHLDPSLIECDQDGNGYWVMVQTQTAWTISEAPEWTVFSEMEGEGNDSCSATRMPVPNCISFKPVLSSLNILLPSLLKSFKPNVQAGPQRLSLAVMRLGQWSVISTGSLLTRPKVTAMTRFW